MMKMFMLGMRKLRNKNNMLFMYIVCVAYNGKEDIRSNCRKKKRKKLLKMTFF